MNIWDHCRLSKRKFGGKEEDYYAIHKFIDASKLFYFNPRHRLLLHNLYGIELTVQKMGDLIINTDQKEILVRDIAAAHCREDLSGRVPSLYDWLKEAESTIAAQIELPDLSDEQLTNFVLTPLFRSNLKASLLITLSNFGVYLAQELLGLEQARTLQASLQTEQLVENYLQQYKFTANWQFTPDRKELGWLANH